ncbi:MULTISPECIES: metallophosphoesterase [Okeania]|uniref:Metallophosphatase family protein n=1 Tax=Okeania hirsuta TaxID=1458930 RepID=A0A3N6NZI3_9CYAN|nr:MULTISPECIES: metallophosphoesterase family protein [Okeania]NET11678.1 metallophosphoesterase [Okeania sp. SIO1H6]NES76194.1 metallophosphoesterase [Okeania sp. SIO1H4]NES87801.1 metallophosphoesterase [Okeania sp. SIO2B9]NET19480.1 metallophosphoesterase [Okeania sp. SIO1H5]NET76568.1 metallophosphoesterase [Okeania sp. SIO1F9]
MNYWAILTGIQGNITAYEAVLTDIKKQKYPVEALYILGDLVGLNRDCKKLVERVRYPKTNELIPQVCMGWWEEQCLILHGLTTTAEPTELIAEYGMDTVKKLWDNVDRETVEWLRNLPFGFSELDCLLIHGSTVGVRDKLTPDTPPIQMLDRLMRFGVNNLFCGRSGLAFQYQLENGSVSSGVTKLGAEVGTIETTSSTQTLTTLRQVIGVGNVGSVPGNATYTLYNPGTNQVKFRTVSEAYS